VSLMKGIEAGTGLRASQVITEVTGLPAERIAVLSGPNLAAETMAGQPAGSHHRMPRRERRATRAEGVPHRLPLILRECSGLQAGGESRLEAALTSAVGTGLHCLPASMAGRAQFGRFCRAM